jgi:hypothetical protein
VKFVITIVATTESSSQLASDALVEVWVVFCDTFVPIFGSNQMRRDPTNASPNPVESVPSPTKLPHIRQSCKREARSWKKVPILRTS